MVWRVSMNLIVTHVVVFRILLANSLAGERIGRFGGTTDVKRRRRQHKLFVQSMRSFIRRREGRGAIVLRLYLCVPIVGLNRF